MRECSFFHYILVLLTWCWSCPVVPSGSHEHIVIQQVTGFSRYGCREWDGKIGSVRESEVDKYGRVCL